MIVTAIGGEPATGKSYIVKELIERLGFFSPYRYGKLLRGISNNNELIFGIYDDDDTFPGTDRLSMAVQPEAINLIKEGNHEHIIFEGDRLFKGSFFNTIRPHCDLRIIIIDCDDEIKCGRHEMRGDEQSQIWLSSRKTAVENIKRNHPHYAKVNNEPGDAKEIVNFILSDIPVGIINPSQTALF